MLSTVCCENLGFDLFEYERDSPLGGDIPDSTRYEIDKAHLVGETIGGTIALQFAYQFPQRLHTVTTCTSPYKFRDVLTYLEYYNLVEDKGVFCYEPQCQLCRFQVGPSLVGLFDLDAPCRARL